MMPRAISIQGSDRVRRLAQPVGAIAVSALLAGVAAMADLAGAAQGGDVQATQSSEAQKAAAKTQKKSPEVVFSEPWPGVAKMEKQRLDAEALPLFGSREPLAFTLTADFRTIGRDRTPDSPRRYPGVLAVAGSDGKLVSIPVQLSTRGTLRLRWCAAVPLRVDFPKKEVQGTPFDGQTNLKLVGHCEDSKEYEQYVLGEYVAYQIINLFTPLSYRARLAKATYVDAASNRPITTRFAFFVEHDDHVADRAKGRIIQFEGRLFSHLDAESTTLMALLQYMVANTDYSIVKLHNVRLIRQQAGAFKPIAYDFDIAGLVNTPYGAPDVQLHLKSTRARLYRGPCRTAEEYEPFLVKFREKKADVMALYDGVPEFDKNYKQTAKDFLEAFYWTIDRKGDIKHEFVDRCSKVGM
jgi:hypothetical protein